MNKWLKFSIAVFGLAVFVYWLKYHSGYFPFEHNPMQYMPNMHRTNAIKPERNSEFFADGSGVRNPPLGSIARNLEYYPYAKETRAEDIPVVANPAERTMANMQQGQHIYNSYCIACHGPKGLGNGLVVPPYPKVPTLVSERVTGLSDSQIFHIITVGQNTMNPYGTQIIEKDRWKLIQYIRALQLAENPTQADIDAFKNIKVEEGRKP